MFGAAERQPVVSISGVVRLEKGDRVKVWRNLLLPLIAHAG